MCVWLGGEEWKGKGAGKNVAEAEREISGKQTRRALQGRQGRDRE